MENVRVHAMVQKHRMNSKGEVPIALCITLENKPVCFTPLKKRVLLSNWDSDLKEVKKGAPNAHLVNALIRMKISELDKEFTERQLLGMRLTKATIKVLAKGASANKSFPVFCRQWLPQKYTNGNTLRTYENEVKKLEAFQEDVSFADISVSFLEQYRRHLEAEGNKPNTIWKSFKFINTVFLDAQKQGIIRERDNPFLLFNRGKYEEPMNAGITNAECALIEQYALKADIPAEARTVALFFLFMCYSGLRISDALRFDPLEHIIEGRLTLCTQKFDVPVKMKPNSRLAWVLNKIIPMGKLNMPEHIFRTWLKVVTVGSGIERPINPHMGRHTFGTLLATARVNIKHAQKLLGHRSEKSTRVYYHIVEQGLDLAVEDLDKIL